MNFDFLGQLNWLAVIVGALIYFALGALWYAPAFLGRRWQRPIGWDPERSLPEMKIATYAIPALAYLVMAVAVGLLAAATGTDTLVEGIVLGLVLGIGLSLMHTLVDATIGRFLQVADGVVVGSGLKVDGRTWNPVDPARVTAFMVAVRDARSAA